MSWSLLQCSIRALLITSSFAFPHVSLQQSFDRAVSGVDAAAVVVRVSDSRVLATHNVDVLTHRLASPGSAIKPFVLELLLETGAIRPEQTIACRRGLRVAGRKLDCSHPPELTNFNAQEALAFSCNSYFVNAASRLKPGELERRFMELGFTRPSGLLSGEGQGRVTAARSLAARQLLAIGVAGIEITPMELAAAYLELARDKSGTDARKTVMAGLRAATDYGLALGAKPKGLSVAGKTGTALDPMGNSTHAWFAGFAPAEKPEVVVVVFVGQGRGSVEAGNLAHRIFEAYEQHRP